MLIHSSIPITLHDNLLTFQDSGKVYETKGDLLEMITNKKYNVDLAKWSDRKLKYDFAQEMNFEIKAICKKSTRCRTLIKLPKSTGFLVSASRISTIFLSLDANELCDRLKLLLQQKQAGNNSNKINGESVAIVNKLLEYNCISKKQHKQILIKCDLL